MLGVILSAIKYGRGPLSLSKKIVLITLRAAWFIGLILSFFEPVIQFERFESGNMKIPVLIDVSASMQNFSPDANVKPFLDTLASLQSRTGGRVNFEYFLFGDSTRARQLPSAAPILFNDHKSYFPAAIDDAGGKFSNDMIIVSDGHWTRPRRSSEVFPRNTVYYLTLPDADPNPFVTISYNAPESSPSDSSFTIDVTASGYVKDRAGLTVSLKERNRTVKKESTEIEQGYFTKTVQFRTSSQHPGRKLYTVEAVIDSAVPPAAASFVHQTVPHFLTYSMYSAKPALDRRYISQALASNNFFRERQASPDILFLFDWDTTAAGLTRSLPRHATAVFLGAMPCSSSRITEPSLSIKLVDDNSSIISPGLDLRSMPPPQEVITCSQQPSRGMKRILQATINTTTAAGVRAGAAPTGNAPNNLTILSSGRFRRIQALFCPIKGFWRWDFWPMSSDRAENELFSFSNTILSAAKELLLDNISDQLILYPANTLTETDSARFMMSLPAAVPIFEPVKLSVQIKNDNAAVDTTMNYSPTGLNRQPLSFHALPPGRYGISSSLDGSGIKAAFADSFTVNKDMSELSVLAQNTQYLQEFAQPLDTRDIPAASSVFDSWDQRSAERNTVVETVRINRSWLLLGIMLALLAAELVLRRRWAVD